MIINIDLQNINTTEVYNVFYILTNVGSNLNESDILTQFGGDFSSPNLTMSLDLINPFNKEIWVVLKEKNGRKFLTKNIYVHGEDFFQNCIQCCTFNGGSFVFNEWEIDCTFGVGVGGEIICQFEGGSYEFESNNLDCTFGVGVGGEIICQFDGGSYEFVSFNVNCNFGVYVDDSNIRPIAKITRDSAGNDTSDLMDSSNNIELYCQYVTTYNNTFTSSAIWQFQELTNLTPWIDSTVVSIGTLQNYPTNNQDFRFRVKIVDSNGLVGYSNIIHKYYIDEPPKKYDAFLDRGEDSSLDLCNQFNGEVILMTFPPQIGDVVYDINNHPLIGYNYVRISDSISFDKTFILDRNTGKIVDNFICQ